MTLNVIPAVYYEIDRLVYILFRYIYRGIGVILVLLFLAGLISLPTGLAWCVAICLYGVYQVVCLRRYKKTALDALL